MRFNIFKFYRLNFCLRNLGLGILGVLSAQGNPFSKQGLLTLLNLLLIQMHSFSTNNYFDYKIWQEENYIKYLVRRRFKRSYCFFFTLLPLCILGGIIFYNQSYSWLLFLYLGLFYLYQGQPRLKNNFLNSIVINGICLGTILYLYPYLFLSGKISYLAIFFSILFFLYLGYHEIIHQIAHLGRDKIRSLPAIIGITKSIKIIQAFLIAVIITAGIFFLLDPSSSPIFLTSIFFSLLRLIKLNQLSPVQESFLKIRNRKDKFYTFQEGILYIIILLWKLYLY